MNNRREYQGEQLRAELMRLRSDRSGIEPWPWQHPFTHIHASALHEAGHAVLACALGRQLCDITVLQDAIGAGSVGRERRENTPKEIVEEVFIAYAGYEAASLYGFVTDDSFDRKRVTELTAERHDLVAINEETAKSYVRKALKAFGAPIEDLAVALFSYGELTGEAATKLITDALPRSEEPLKNLKRDVERLAAKKPVLVLGRGLDGCKDVDEIVDFYGHDQSLYCVKVPCADSRDVLLTIETWLKDNPHAEILCLGMHGTPSGLRPKRQSDGAQITFSELGKLMGKNFCGRFEHLTVFLGACRSDHAAGVWNALNRLPIHRLVAFSGDEKISVVRDALGIFLKQGSLLEPGERVVEKPISSLEEDIEDLQKSFSSIRIYHRPERAAQLAKVSGDGVVELGRQLERRGRVGDKGSLMDAVRDTMRSDNRNEENGAATTPATRARVGTQTIGSLPTKKTRPRRRR